MDFQLIKIYASALIGMRNKNLLIWASGCLRTEISQNSRFIIRFSEVNFRDSNVLKIPRGKTATLSGMESLSVNVQHVITKLFHFIERENERKEMRTEKLNYKKINETQAPRKRHARQHSFSTWHSGMLRLCSYAKCA